MTRLLITSFILSLLLTACISEQQKSEIRRNVLSMEGTVEDRTDSIIFKTYGVKSEIEGVDSLTVLSANGKVLFKIAEGGNLELLTDTVMRMGTTNVGIITLADYFQDNQIFYVIYNPSSSVSLQSSRLYLPYIGMDISQYKQLDSITIDGDSLLIKSHEQPEINLLLALDTLKYDNDGIINYYEFK